MIVRGSLQAGPTIVLQFYGEDDLVTDEYSDEPRPVSWAQLSMPGDDARKLLAWLRGDRKRDFQYGSLRANGSGDWLVIDDNLAGLAIRLGTAAAITLIADQLSGALSLIQGEPFKPS